MPDRVFSDMNNQLLSSLISTHSDMLYRYAFWLTGETNQAEYLVLSVFQHARQRLNSLLKAHSSKRWLAKTLKQEHLCALEEKHSHHSDQSLATGPSSPDHPAPSLRSVLANMPESYREPLFLQMVMGFSLQDICFITGMSGHKVTRRLLQARQVLRKHFATNEQHAEPGNRHELP